MTLTQLKAELERQADPAKAEVLRRFFKTGPGEYGEGDVFLGVTVPRQRALARRFRELPRARVLALLRSPVHEHRLVALLILIEQFERGDARAQGAIVDAYLAHTAWVNNWDLVDSSAPRLLGAWLVARPRRRLYRLARSRLLWDRRIAMLATYAFIKRDDFDDALRLAKLLVADPHDLIHKAVGWMLREIGKRDLRAEEGFLDAHAAHMPRTMLRYAIEKFPPAKRRRYLGR